MSSTWDARVEDAREEIRNVRYDINERGTAQGATPSQLKAIDKNIRRGLQTIENSIQTLDADLALERERSRNQRNVVRHQRDLDNLRHDLTNLRNEHQRASQSAERQHLLSSRVGGSDQRYVPPHDPLADMNTQQLLEQHKQAERDQDAIIDELTVGVGNLKHLGKNIGEEADLHIRLLDDFEADVDKGNRNLNKQTGRAKEVTRDADGVCWMYVLICLLVLVLVALCIFVFT